MTSTGRTGPALIPDVVELPKPWRDSVVSVVVPTYNEAGNLAELTDRVFDLGLPNLRLIIADDNSPDGTGKLADELAAKVNGEGGRMHVLHRKAKEGLGRAHIAGMRHGLDAGDEYFVQMDGDLSHPPEFIPQMLGTMLSTGAGLVIGSRYVIGGQRSSQWGLHRRLLSWGAGVYVNTLLGLGVRDPTAGFKIWRRDVLEAIQLDSIRSDGYSFQVEMNYLCKRMGFGIVEIPIHFQERLTGKSKITIAVQMESAKIPFALRLAHRGRR